MKKIVLGLFLVGILSAQTQQTATVNGAGYQQVSIGSVHVDPNKFATDTGTVNNYVIAPPIAAALTAGAEAFFTTTNANTSTVQINVSSLGNKNVTKYGTTALVTGDILTGAIYHIQYDGTEWQLLNPSSAPACSSCNTSTSTMNANYPVIGGASGRLIATSTNSPVVAYTITYSSTPVITLSNGNLQTITLTGAATATVVTTSALPGLYTFNICEDATGGRAFTWPATFRGATTAISSTSTASKCNSQTFSFDGTNIMSYGIPVLNQ